MDGEISDDFYLSFPYLCLLIFSCFYNINVYLLYNAGKDFSSKLMIFPAFVGKEPLTVFESNVQLFIAADTVPGSPARNLFQPPSRTSSCPAVFRKLKMILLDSFAARVSDETWVVPMRSPHAQLEFERKAGCAVQVRADHSRSCMFLQPLASAC